MVPTLMPGDWALVVEGRRRRGDVFVVEHPGRPGYEIVKHRGRPRAAACANRALALDEFWVEGDRADASTDSRQFGPVRREHEGARARSTGRRSDADGSPSHETESEAFERKASSPGTAKAHVVPRPPSRTSSLPSPSSSSCPTPPAKPVVAAPHQMVVARSTARAILVQRSLELVVASAAQEHVAAEASRELVVAGRPDHVHRTAEAPDELVGAAIAVGPRRAALVLPVTVDAASDRRTSSASACVGVGPPF